MSMTELELLKVNIAELAARSRNDTVGILVSLIISKNLVVDPNDFSIFMQTEFNTNQTVFDPEEMRVDLDDGYDGLVSITPILLLEGRPQQLFLTAKKSGLQFISAISGDDYYGNISSCWGVGTKVANAGIQQLEEKFMADVFTRAAKLANFQNCCIHIGITAGWGMKNYIGDLETFDDEEIEKAGRLLWQRTPFG